MNSYGMDSGSLLKAIMGPVEVTWWVTVSWKIMPHLLFLSFLDRAWESRSQVLKGIIQEIFHLGLVFVVSVMSEELIKM